MQLLNDELLAKFSRRNGGTRQWLTKWARAVSESDWQSLSDLHKAYPSADGVPLKSGNVVTVFNVKGNRYRLLTYVSFELQAVQVIEIFSHAEYDKQLWKERY
jgi:mRNA interferase HigB